MHFWDSLGHVFFYRLIYNWVKGLRVVRLRCNEKPDDYIYFTNMISSLSDFFVLLGIIRFSEFYGYR